MAKKKQVALGASKADEVDSRAAKNDSLEKKEPIENWANKPDSDIYEKCVKFYPKIVQAYKNREEADDAIAEYWNIYNAKPDDNQMYQGNSQSYLPAVRDSINARAKRALKQNFPSKFKHVEAVGSDGRSPRPQLALLEHYIRTTKLKSVCRSMYIAGDVTGQWNVYVDWLREVRSVTNMIKRNPILETVEGEKVEARDPTDETDELEDQDIVEEGPVIIDFAIEDLAVIPPTCNNIEKAEVVSLKLRMYEDEVQRLVDEGIFILPEGKDAGEWMEDKKGKDKPNPSKSRTQDAGIKTEGTNKYVLIFEATARLEFEKGKKSLAYIYYAGENDIVGIIKAPQWGQKRPTISAPVERISGSFYGKSKIEPVKWLQWNLNDFWNMGQDSATYSLLPIVMTDPEKNPNYAMMVYGLAAVWPVDPNSTQIQSFPQLWKDADMICASMEAKINKSLDVNDSMMGRAPQGRKNANAVGAQQQEQSVPILDHAERFEEEILSGLMERIFEYDCQFREESLSVLTLGEIGVEASMQEIPPQQWGQRYFFQWFGTDFVMNMQRMQQQNATMNVLRGIPPQQLNGRRLDITPILEVLSDNVFGTELSSRILIDDRNKFTVDPEIEDEMMLNGITIEVHEYDDDLEHLKKHQVAGQTSGDPAGLIRTHMQAHMKQLQQKRQMQMGAQQQQAGAPGMPGGAGPGVAGTPRPGGMAAGPQGGAQQPPGAIGPDQMPGGIPRG